MPSVEKIKSFCQASEVKCPVCDSVMHQTNNPNLYICNVLRRTYLEYFRESIDYYDGAVEFGEGGKYVFQQYQFPPYKITIRRNGKTEVVAIVKFIYDDHLGTYESAVPVRELVFQTDYPLDLPLQDFDKCVKKLNLLTTFS